jgi:hypothetical protein
VPKVIGRLRGGRVLITSAATVGAGFALVSIATGPADATMEEIVVNDAENDGLSAPAAWRAKPRAA